MADVRPINALHYDLGVVGSLGDVAAPPYDVIDTELRAELLARSPYNAVAIDLPKPYGQSGPGGREGDPYETAARDDRGLARGGALVDDPEPAIWAMTQDYTGPDGESRTRHGILGRVRVEDFDAGQVLPHERTLPGPKKDRLDLTRATRHNLSPIFSLAPRTPGRWSRRRSRRKPWGEATDEGGTVNRVWRVGDPEVLAAVTELLGGAQLLIADGHHRYETALAYRDEVGGEGAHDFTLMALTGLDDPGLTVFPTHRLLSGFAEDPERQRSLGDGPARALRRRGGRRRGARPARRAGRRRLRPLRLLPPARLPAAAEGRGIAALDERLAGKPEAYRRLDSAILETLVLKGIAGMSEDDILAKRGIGYAKNVPDSLALLEDGSYDVAFILRPIPVDQVKAISESDENMPPKSTYFFPKVMTGLVFNPVG